jgi:Kef-type K+ transport system membrane component KefB
MTQVLSIALRKLRQPRIIAEVLGGILLGATPALPAVCLS